MMIEVELWHLVTLLLAFFGCVAGFGKLLMRQFEKRLDTRFEVQDQMRELGAKDLRATIERYTAQGEKTAGQLQSLEREFLEWKAEMPVIYVRREDYIRGQTVLEAKQDALYSETKFIQLLFEKLAIMLKGQSNV